MSKLRELKLVAAVMLSILFVCLDGFFGREAESIKRIRAATTIPFVSLVTGGISSHSLKLREAMSTSKRCPGGNRSEGHTC
jgi:hypothetical protein